jgi:DNA modification methylase
VSWSVLCADVLEGLAALPDASFDACLCDPPYLLEFMGKDFDRQHLLREGANDGQRMQAWHGEWAAGLLRVLKPGAFLFAFGGSRTYHRLACAIEDAGFEIRDSMMVPGAAWLYGSGFPKSLDISKAIDKAAPRATMFAPFAAHYAERRRALGLTHAAICAEVGAYGRINHGGASVNWECGYGVPTVAQWGTLAALLDLSDEFLPLIKRAEAEREKIGESGGAKLAVAPGQNNDRSAITLDLTAPATPDAARWNGYGTAMKPSWEPLVVAMKPLDGTFAANAMEHGVAGLNIDGSRVASAPGDRTDRAGGEAQKWGTNTYARDSYSVNARGSESPAHAAGRWPPNLAFVHHPDCREVGTATIASNSHHPASRGRGGLGTSGHTGQSGLEERRDSREKIAAWRCVEDCPVRQLDEQAGDRSSTRAGGNPNNPWHGGHPENASSWNLCDGKDGVDHRDTGSASRFFYCSKVSRSERERGLLGHIRCAHCGGLDSTEHTLPDGRVVPCSRNLHPTLKPIDLCRWFATLLLPPKRAEGEPSRRLLVPFSGSGSEIAGAVLAGWDQVVGIERSPLDCLVSRYRIGSVDHRAILAERPRMATIEGPLFEAAS